MGHAALVGRHIEISRPGPILIGGLVRWAVDKYLAKKLAHKNLTEEELAAEGDRSAGVLMASVEKPLPAVAGYVFEPIAVGPGGVSVGVSTSPGFAR